MGDQGSDSANTQASVAELVHQLLDQSTRLARARQAGLLAAGGRGAARNRGRNAQRRAVSGGKTGRLYDRARDVRPTRSDVSTLDGEVRQ